MGLKKAVIGTGVFFILLGIILIVVGSLGLEKDETSTDKAHNPNYSIDWTGAHACCIYAGLIGLLVLGILPIVVYERVSRGGAAAEEE